MHISDDKLKLIESFAAVGRCPVMAFDNDSDILHNCGSCGFSCPAADGCAKVHSYASFQSERFGGKYIYFCPGGFVFIASAVNTGEECYSLLAGPIMATDRENFLPADLAEPFTDSKNDIKLLSPFIDTLKHFEPDTITDLANMLAALAGYFSGGEYIRRRTLKEKQLQQKQINDYIQSIKARIILGVDSFTPYPYDKEKQLIYAIQTGNTADARRYLNEILGHIFFASADNLEAIKIRAMELCVLISRAALDSGADMNSIYQYNVQILSDFFELQTIEDVCATLTEILRRFSDETFRFMEVKHVDLLSKAVSFIRTNYMHKISLEDVADYIYLSPSYLSKIFKEELGTNFNSYLNLVRIEKSKILLLSEQLSISEVSELVGFFDQSYFNKVFKRITGMTPKKYREQKRNL